LHWRWNDGALGLLVEVLTGRDNIFLPDRKTASAEHGKQKQDLK
jgi:hypothetical protein